MALSTRAVCAKAGVAAPTLYHHFGNADGLLSAAITAGFQRFLASKLSIDYATDPVEALRQGWDHYVEFAAEHPNLYAAMAARFLGGATFPAADAGRAVLDQRIADIAAQGRLRVTTSAATDLIFATAHGAATLFLLGNADRDVVKILRDSTISTIVTDSERKTPL